MLILKVTAPDGRVKYLAGAFPSACGKTNLAMLDPDAPGLEGRDHRRRHRLDAVRRRRPPLRDQPRGRLLRRRARHQREDQPERHGTLRANAIFTNCALTDDGDIWWEGMTEEPPAHAIDWKGKDWTPDSEAPAAHPNARFTAPAPGPLDRARVGGPRRRADRRDHVRRPARDDVPLVREAFDWEHGVFMGATMSSETTAAAFGEVGKLRFDPFAMLPFCGYNMADYWAHWLDVGRAATPTSCRGSSTSTGSARTRTAASCGRASARTAACSSGSSAAATARPTPRRRRSARAGARRPRHRRLDISDEDLAELLTVDPDELREQLPQIKEHLAQFGDRPARRAARAARGARAPASKLRVVRGRCGASRRKQHHQVRTRVSTC